MKTLALAAGRGFTAPAAGSRLTAAFLAAAAVLAIGAVRPAPAAASTPAAGSGVTSAPAVSGRGPALLDAAAGRRLLSAAPPAARDGAKAAGSILELAGVIVADFEPGAGVDDAAAAATAAGARISAASPWWADDPDHPLARLRLLFFPVDVDAGEVAAAVAAAPGVRWAEPCMAHTVSATPDDPLAADQYHLPMVRAAQGWDLARGEWNPVLLAVIDAGIDIDHPDLAPNVQLNPADPPNGLDDDGNGFVDDHRGWNFAAGNDDPGALAAATPQAVMHGTHVAGLAAAVCDNGLDIAGLGWNGPVLCVAAGSAVADNVVAFGFQAMLYAAERGARIINCSWGRPRTTSRLEVEVLEYLRTLGVLVVAAAGNEGGSEPFYPAAYPGVLAVANVTADTLRNSSSNYGDWVDMAAPGTFILSLAAGDGITRLSGTSMASPLVAAAGALLAGLRPELDPRQMGLQLRVSSVPVPSDGIAGQRGLGHGLLAVDRALLWRGPGLWIEDLAVEDRDGDGFVSAGESMTVRPVWRNILDRATGDVDVRVYYAAEDGGGSDGPEPVPAGGFTLPPVPAGGQPVAPAALVLTPEGGLPPGEKIRLLWEWEDPLADPPYGDRQLIEVAGPPLGVDSTEGEIDFTLAGNGRLGFHGRGGGDGEDGIGVRYSPLAAQHGAVASTGLLFEGALIVGTGPDRLSDGARFAPDGDYHRHWQAPTFSDLPAPAATYVLSGGQRLHAARASYADSGAPSPLGLRVTATALAPEPEVYPGTALVLLEIRNEGTGGLSGLRAGWFLDWDLPESGDLAVVGPNTTARDAESGLALTWRDSDPGGLTVAADLLSADGAPAVVRLIDNVAGADWNIYDGYSEAEKWDSLLGEAAPAEVGGTDVSQILSLGPFALAPGDSLRCVLLLAAGNSRGQAVANAGGGRGLAALVLSESLWRTDGAFGTVGAPYPNPASGMVRIDVEGNHLAPWRLMVYDLRGRLVHAGEEFLAGGGGTLVWDCLDRDGRPAPSGSYLIEVSQPGSARSAKFTLLR